MALIAAGGAGGGSGGTTSALNMTGATLLIACVSVDASSGTVPTPTDSSGNTWSLLTQVGGTNPPFFRSRLYYVQNPTVTSSQTFTIAGTNASITVAGFDGTLTSGVFDLEASGGGAATNSTETASGGSVTPSVADSLVISGGGFEAVRTLSVGGSFSIAHQQNHVGGTSYGSFIGYRILTASAAQNPTWDCTGQGTTNFVVLNAVFKAVSVSPTLTQSAYRWRNDDGSETTATAAAAQNTDITVATGVTKRLRVQVQAVNNPAATAFKLQYRKVGGSTWRDV